MTKGGKGENPYRVVTDVKQILATHQKKVAATITTEPFDLKDYRYSAEYKDYMKKAEKAAPGLIFTNPMDINHMFIDIHGSSDSTAIKLAKIKAIMKVYPAILENEGNIRIIADIIKQDLEVKAKKVAAKEVNRQQNLPDEKRRVVIERAKREYIADGIAYEFAVANPFKSENAFKSVNRNLPYPVIEEMLITAYVNPETMLKPSPKMQIDLMKLRNEVIDVQDFLKFTALLTYVSPHINVGVKAEEVREHYNEMLNTACGKKPVNYELVQQILKRPEIDFIYNYEKHSKNSLDVTNLRNLRIEDVMLNLKMRKDKNLPIKDAEEMLLLEFFDKHTKLPELEKLIRELNITKNNSPKQAARNAKPNVKTPAPVTPKTTTLAEDLDKMTSLFKAGLKDFKAAIFTTPMEVLNDPELNAPQKLSKLIEIKTNGRLAIESTDGLLRKAYDDKLGDVVAFLYNAGIHPAEKELDIKKYLVKRRLIKDDAKLFSEVLNEEMVNAIAKKDIAKINELFAEAGPADKEKLAKDIFESALKDDNKPPFYAAVVTKEEYNNEKTRANLIKEAIEDKDISKIEKLLAIMKPIEQQKYSKEVILAACDDMIFDHRSRKFLRDVIDKWGDVELIQEMRKEELNKDIPQQNKKFLTKTFGLGQLDVTQDAALKHFKSADAKDVKEYENTYMDQLNNMYVNFAISDKDMDPQVQQGVKYNILLDIAVYQRDNRHIALYDTTVTKIATMLHTKELFALRDWNSFSSKTIDDALKIKLEKYPKEFIEEAKGIDMQKLFALRKQMNDTDARKTIDEATRANIKGPVAFVMDAEKNNDMDRIIFATTHFKNELLATEVPLKGIENLKYKKAYHKYTDPEYLIESALKSDKLENVKLVLRHLASKILDAKDHKEPTFEAQKELYKINKHMQPERLLDKALDSKNAGHMKVILEHVKLDEKGPVAVKKLAFKAQLKVTEMEIERGENPQQKLQEGLATVKKLFDENSKEYGEFIKTVQGKFPEKFKDEKQPVKQNDVKRVDDFSLSDEWVDVVAKQHASDEKKSSSHAAQVGSKKDAKADPKPNPAAGFR